MESHRGSYLPEEGDDTEPLNMEPIPIYDPENQPLPHFELDDTAQENIVDAIQGFVEDYQERENQPDAEDTGMIARGMIGNLRRTIEAPMEAKQGFIDPLTDLAINDAISRQLITEIQRNRPALRGRNLAFYTTLDHLQTAFETMLGGKEKMEETIQEEDEESAQEQEFVSDEDILAVEDRPDLSRAPTENNRKTLGGEKKEILDDIPDANL